MTEAVLLQRPWACSSGEASCFDLRLHLHGKAAIRPYLQGWFTAFPHMSSRSKNRVVSEDQVAAEVEFTGTNSGPMQMAPGAPAIPATGRKVTGQGVYFLRIQNGKVVAVHSYPNVAGLMMQLGLIPPPPGS